MGFEGHAGAEKTHCGLITTEYNHTPKNLSLEAPQAIECGEKSPHKEENDRTWVLHMKKYL